MPEKNKKARAGAVSNSTVEIEDTVVRRLVFQTFGRARKTQDSPIVPDVWMEFIKRAARIAGTVSSDADKVDVLLTPWTGVTPGDVVKHLSRTIPASELAGACIAQSTTRVVARLTIEAVAKYVVPFSGWWEKWLKEADFERFERARTDEATLLTAIDRGGNSGELIRYATLVGFILRLKGAETEREVIAARELAAQLGPADDGDDDHLPALPVKEIQKLLSLYHRNVRPAAAPSEATPHRIYLINRNRPAAHAVMLGRKTVKADAAERLFEFEADGIAFAVVDGGIDATHPAFACAEPPAKGEFPTRVKATYDFTILRDLIASQGDLERMSGENRPRVEAIVKGNGLKRELGYFKDRSTSTYELDWGLVEKFIRVPHRKLLYRGPGTDHGTHVAGILAANWKDGDQGPIYGICPNLKLYDFRVFDSRGKGDEFAILCALEFVDWLNRDRQNPVIHGVNLSLALRHDVDSFACGQTPVCEVCNHLVGAGTVVVAAAGNTGFDDEVGKANLGAGYRMVSITDPGNAESVITVGSTHRRDPHAYGVSYFSARGPTGDGRRKPDILAPGEKITSTIRDSGSQRMDGTSMAAPHVSGAAALLMARYPELIGRPGRIKEILMRTATDLKREPYFQGAGLLDILRALQSV